MKLARLLLFAFGPFTNKTLDFSAGAGNIHVIYGANEAGKSSALRAMTDLRFGIPLRSPDDFVHPAGELRIGGVFIDQTGRPVGLIRRKGRGTTLSGLDVHTEQTDPGFAVDSRLERELTGGLDRQEFEAMFGLNHARLREGGAVLLNGEGDLGSALFEASAGTSGIATLLAALDTDAKKLYSQHGRAQNAVINEARRQLDEQRKVWREAQTKPAEWQALNRAHDTAKTALDDLTKALETLRRRENELTELRTVEPLLREHDRLAAVLESYAEVPDLSEQQREERLAAEQALQRAQRDLQEAEEELARCAAALDGLVIEPLLLDHAEAIERLVSGVEAAARNRHDVHQQNSVIARIEGELDLVAARLAPGVDRRTLLEAVPSAADRVALEGHLTDVSRLSERLQGYRERAAALDAALQPAGAWPDTVADPRHKQALVTALRAGQAQGDVVRQKTELDRRLRELEGQLALALSELGLESEQALRRSQPVLDAQIAQAKQDLMEIEAQLAKWRDESERVARDLDGQRLRQRQLAAEGEVVTAETLRLARAKRSEEWTAIRRAYIDQTSGTDQLALGFDATKALPETFEASVGEADRQADLLRADTKRAAGLEECSARIEQMEVRRKELAGEIAARRLDRDRVQAAWILLGALDWSRLILREDGLNAGGGPDHLAEPWAIALQEARLSTFLAAGGNNASLDPTYDTRDAFLSGQVLDAQARLNAANLVVDGKVSATAVASFTRLYEFMSQIVEYESTDLEKLSLYARHLGPLLREEVDPAELIDLSSVESVVQPFIPQTSSQDQRLKFL